MALDHPDPVFDALSASDKQEFYMRLAFDLTVAARELYDIEPRLAHRYFVGLNEAQHQLIQHLRHTAQGAPGYDPDRLLYIVLDKARVFGGHALVRQCARSVLQRMVAVTPALRSI